MKPIYLYDVGIKPWEQTKTVSDCRFATITVVQGSIEELFSLWLMITNYIVDCLPRVLKWRTVGHAVKGSKVQELKLLKQLKSVLESDDLLGKNEDSGVYSYVKKLRAPLVEFDLNSITQPLYTVLVFVPDETPNLSSVWDVFKCSDEGLDVTSLETALSKHENMLICRVIESDTHASTQFIGSVEVVDKLLARVTDLDITRVQEGEVVRLINE